jgi:short-subunit dehydrogenase
MTDLAIYGPWAVIAGGSEGVGAEFARQLARAGLNLVLLARKAGPLEIIANDCRSHGVQVRTLAVDLVEPRALAEIICDNRYRGRFTRLQRRGQHLQRAVPGR